MIHAAPAIARFSAFAPQSTWWWGLEMTAGSQMSNWNRSIIAVSSRAALFPLPRLYDSLSCGSSSPLIKPAAANLSFLRSDNAHDACAFPDLMRAMLR
jgi:hypothetical protein